MARVVAHVTDLLFGSKVQGMLAAAGHDVTLAGSESGVRDAIGGSDLLVVDLFFEPDAGIALLAGLKADGTEFMRFERSMLIAKRGHSVEDKANY